ncbi:MAG: 50S ribosomal protein L11 methyltransferase [Granulosicoccus sp.]|nr:50S ribosomal protein L11 methyltransferase [Granulosicoccus sp.]
MTNDWLEVEVTGPADQTEQLEEWLYAAGALSISLLDALDDDELNHAVLEPAPDEMRLWDNVRLKGLFAQGSDLNEVHDALHLAALEIAISVPEFRIRPLTDQPWEKLWMRDFHPLQFGEKFWICPSHREPVDDSAVNLRLDPGLAFGTGDHPTTAQCLEWLGKHSSAGEATLANRTVIDYGCGSGVLAIASLLLGAESAWAVDIDEQALTAASENARINGVLTRLNIGFPSLVSTISADIVFANILFQPLMSLADTLARCVRPEGELILSGLLEDQIEPVRLRYNKRFSFTQSRSQAGWALLEARRRDDVRGFE